MKETRELKKAFTNSFLFFCLYSLKMKLSCHESMILCALYTRTPVIRRWECILSIRTLTTRNIAHPALFLESCFSPCVASWLENYFSS
jgi:hypothetical protein